VTGYVRALLAEIMNALPNHVLIFSCTTDGFLSTATRDEIDTACEGVMASAYRKARFDVAGSDEIIELKHQTGQLLGWRPLLTHSGGRRGLLAGTCYDDWLIAVHHPV